MYALSFNYLTAARALDIGLMALFAATVALILIKTVDLYFPVRFYGKTGLVAEIRAKALPGSSEFEHRKLVLHFEESLERLEAGLPLLATIAASGPFVGLGGTVLHIIDALSKLSGAALDISLITGPISTALFSTLLGLLSAVLAGVAYNVFVRKLQTIEGKCTRLIRKVAP